MSQIEIRRNSDGVVRQYVDEFLWEAGSEYLWADGNYSCDCNRYLFFERAAGATPEWNAYGDCTDGCYSVRITDDAGKLLYEDGEWGA